MFLQANQVDITFFKFSFVQESPRWLLQKGKLDEARNAVLTMGKWDRTNTPEKEAEVDEIIENERKRIRQVPRFPLARKFCTFFRAFF